MKITLQLEADSALELQNAVLQLADFCTLAGDNNKPIPFTVVEAGEAVETQAVSAPVPVPSPPPPIRP